MNSLELSQERASRLRIALLKELARIRAELATCKRPSIRAATLEAHLKGIIEVLHADEQLEGQAAGLAGKG